MGSSGINSLLPAMLINKNGNTSGAVSDASLALMAGTSGNVNPAALLLAANADDSQLENSCRSPSKVRPATSTPCRLLTSRRSQMLKSQTLSSPLASKIQPPPSTPQVVMSMLFDSEKALSTSPATQVLLIWLSTPLLLIRSPSWVFSTLDPQLDTLPLSRLTQASHGVPPLLVIQCLPLLPPKTQFSQ